MRRTTLDRDFGPHGLFVDGDGDEGGGGGGGGGQHASADWPTMLSSLPAELRESVPDLDTTKDFPSFVEQYKNHRAMIGKNRLPVLGKDADLEETYNFFKTLGRPDKASEYELGDDFGAPEGVPWDEESLPELLDVLHRAGLNNDQVRTIARGYVDAAKNHWERMSGGLEELYQDGERALRREWGNSYDAKLDLGHRAWRQMAGDEFDDVESIFLSDGRRLGDHPVMIRIMAKAGELLKDHGLLGESPGGGGKLKPVALRSKIREIEGDQRFRDPSHPQNEELVRQWNELIEQLGEEPLNPTEDDDLFR